MLRAMLRLTVNDNEFALGEVEGETAYEFTKNAIQLLDDIVVEIKKTRQELAKGL